MTCGAFTGTGKAVVTGSADASVRLWNPKTGACMHTFGGYGWHSEPINALACAVDVSRCREGLLLDRRVEGGRRRHRF